LRLVKTTTEFAAQFMRVTVSGRSNRPGVPRYRRGSYQLSVDVTDPMGNHGSAAQTLSVTQGTFLKDVRDMGLFGAGKQDLSA
jgi:hypothetical protein